MPQETYLKLGRPETEQLLVDINPLLEGITLDPASVTVLAQRLAFYPGYRFLEVSDFGSIPAIQRFIVHKPGRTVILDGTNEPVYALNHDAPLALTPATIEAYVRFFFAHVRGRHGRFIIVETTDDIAWKEELPAPARKTVGELLQPLFIEGPKTNGSYRAVAHVVFKNALFKMEIAITNDGQVTLGKEELLVDDMPILDDTLGQ